jgi:hypothetical protein
MEGAGASRPLLFLRQWGLLTATSALLMVWEVFGELLRKRPESTERQEMKRFRIPKPNLLLGVIAVVLAIGGTAVAAGPLHLGDFDSSSRDRLAGTGVIQFASQTSNTGAVDANDPKTFKVQCELSKKATAGGFKWTDNTVPKPSDYQFVDSYPNGGGFVVRLYILGPTAANKSLAVYSNCVKSRKQNGTPPS